MDVNLLLTKAEFYLIRSYKNEIRILLDLLFVLYKTFTMTKQNLRTTFFGEVINSIYRRYTIQINTYFYRNENRCCEVYQFCGEPLLFVHLYKIITLLSYS